MALTCQDCLDGKSWRCKDKGCANYRNARENRTSTRPKQRRTTPRPAPKRTSAKNVASKAPVSPPEPPRTPRTGPVTPPIAAAVVLAWAEGVTLQEIESRLQGEQAPKISR